MASTGASHPRHAACSERGGVAGDFVPLARKQCSGGHLSSLPPSLSLTLSLSLSLSLSISLFVSVPVSLRSPWLSFGPRSFGLFKLTSTPTPSAVSRGALNTHPGRSPKPRPYKIQSPTVDAKLRRPGTCFDQPESSFLSSRREPFIGRLHLMVRAKLPAWDPCPVGQQRCKITVPQSSFEGEGVRHPVGDHRR